jgi:hypothetical protein
VGHGQMKNTYEVLLRKNLNEEENLEDLRLDRIILTLISKTLGVD